MKGAKTSVRLAGNISLLFRKPDSGQRDYPACMIHKGPVLVCGNKDLAEEGIGFGVPLLKFGHETIFPGDASIATEKDSDIPIVKVNYDLNLVERMAVKGNKSIDSKIFYKIKEYFSWLHREYPPLRGFLTSASNNLRLTCGIETIFEKAASAGMASVLYTIYTGEGLVHIDVDLSRVKKDGCTEIIIMNEQGANHFNRYCDSNGALLTGNEVGTWNETFADWASFIDSDDKLAFTLSKVNGAKMFRGRELVEKRLAWSGLAYVLPRCTVNFAYDIRIGENA